MTPAATALDGVRVLELGGGEGYAVGYATRLLADLGADVVMVEPPEGHRLRRSGGSFEDDPVVAGRVFSVLSAGKRSVTLPLDADSAEVLARLGRWCDVIVDGLGAGAMIELGLADEDLVASPRHPVVVHVSPWGSSGPYRDRPATGLVLQAAAGWVSTRQEPGLPLVQVGGQMHEWIAGSYIAAAVMTGRAHAARSGTGVAVDFSVFECIHSTIPYSRLMADTNAELGFGATAATWTPFGIRPCRDGWVGINILTGQQWADACLMTGLGEFTDQQQELIRGEGNRERFEKLLVEWLADRTVNEVVDLGQSLRIPIVPVATGRSAEGLPQWAQRPFFQAVPDGDSSFSRPGPPWRLTETPAHGSRPAPRPGEHTEAVLAAIDPTTTGENA